MVLFKELVALLFCLKVLAILYDREKIEDTKNNKSQRDLVGATLNFVLGGGIKTQAEINRGRGLAVMLLQIEAHIENLEMSQCSKLS
ncbi:unnamed protein product [Arabis nemorensis]|uniref:Uncharacterized protein n=1 Tax=Arabis nemorensis TaxID=586526 RepID=A0A565C663_9BRAS|nr:unnamed protein product [Arabis nemorensis]